MGYFFITPARVGSAFDGKGKENTEKGWGGRSRGKCFRGRSWGGHQRFVKDVFLNKEVAKGAEARLSEPWVEAAFKAKARRSQRLF